MTKKFLLASLATAVLAFILNGLAYYLFLKNFFQSHPAISPEFIKQLYRPDEELVIWALVASMLALGFLITTVIKWSGARTFTSGIKSAFIFAFLMYC
jgi:ABC-type Mn2+/Zn2+ transport system permease subunit